MNIYKLLILILIILSGFLISSLANQSDSDYWVYEINELDDSYEVSRTNALTNTTEVIVSVPKTPSFNLSSIIPVEELEMAKAFLANSIYATNEDFSVNDFFDRPPVAILQYISLSPDARTLALTIIYRICIPTGYMPCFGVNQIVLVTIDSGQQQVLWSLPIQAETRFIPYCFPWINGVAINDAFIRAIRWSPNQEAIVAELNYGSMVPDNPLVIIPINNPSSAFLAGNGEKDWVISSDSHEITALSTNCSGSLGDAARVTSFDLATAQTTYMNYPIDPTVASVVHDIGAAYVRDTIIFPIMLGRPGDAGPHLYRLAVLDPSKMNEVIIFDTPISTFQQVKSSLSGEVAVVEDENGLLWRLLLDTDDFELVPIIEAPVIYWQFANDDELIVKFEGEENYSIIEIP